jgi:valine--pyruvate aminotransferase
MSSFSTFGEKFSGESGILQLMADLGTAVRQPGAIMLGGGNPSHITAVQDLFRDRMAHILDSEREFEDLIGNYDTPQGHQAFIQELTSFFQREYGWHITPKNIILTNGSQTAFFCLFNLLAGDYPDGSRKRILLPLAPEYIGYEDVGISPDIFVAYKPEIEFLGDHLFKYRIDFASLQLDASISAICVSRPTNPTGNVLTQQEMRQLSELAKSHNIPFIVDNAYGLPFPNIIFTEAQPEWEPHIIMCMSLSKLGLPGARTGIVIAAEPIIQALQGMNAVISLAPNGFGPALAVDAVRTGEIMRISREHIRPHYEQKAQLAVQWLREALGEVDYFIHKPEGAIFLWLWFRGLPISSQELYERLKARGVIIVPGHYFFPGYTAVWPHKQECIRMNYAQDEAIVRAGIHIIAEEVIKAYANE